MHISLGDRRTMHNEMLSSFQALLAELSTLDKEAIAPKIKLYCPDESDSEYIQCCLSRVSTISQIAQEVLLKQDKIHTCKDWERHFRTISKYCYNLECCSKSDISDIYQHLTCITGSLQFLNSDLPPPQNFVNRFFSRDEEKYARDELNEYISNGEIIVNSDDYEGSNLDKLDRLLLETDTVIANEFQDIEMKLETGKSFVAIAVPGMVGKTQSAFTLRRVKPLYFPIWEAIGSEGLVSHYIYRNFTAHTVKLRSCAEKDISGIGDSKIGAESMKNVCKTGYLWTLGFLKGIVDLAAGKDFSTGTTWMEYLAKIENFSFERIRLDSIPEGHFSGFCLFLDEYFSEPWSVFVRNLARVIGIKCVCARNSFKVVQMDEFSAESGTGEASIWSIVITKLNSPSLGLLNKKFHLNESIEAIKNLAKNSSINVFLDNFSKVQLANLRPGVATCFALALKYYVEHLLSLENGTSTFGEMMDFVTKQLAEDLINRKFTLRNEDGRQGTIALLFPETYFNPRMLNDKEIGQENTDVIEAANDLRNNENATYFCNQSKFLSRHLFYLPNPQFPGKWMFLTFTPQDDSQDRSLRYCAGKASFRRWTEECMYFEPSEIFTMLACLFSKSLVPVTRALLNAQNGQQYKQSDVFKFPENPVEAAAAVSVVTASQHSFFFQDCSMRRFGTGEKFYFSSRIFSFSGQKGTTLVRNLVLDLKTDRYISLNLILLKSNGKPRGLAEIEFYPSTLFDLKADFLEKLHVPFLYSIDRSVPFLDSFSDPASGFFVEKYSYIEDDGQIDGGTFEALFNGQPRNVVIEHKNWQSAINPDQLQSILEKILKRNDPVLSLIFCLSCFRLSADFFDFLNYCKANKIIVYRVKKVKFIFNIDTFKIFPYFKEGVFSDPKHICILLESRMINLDLSK